MIQVLFYCRCRVLSAEFFKETIKCVNLISLSVSRIYINAKKFKVSDLLKLRKGNIAIIETSLLGASTCFSFQVLFPRQIFAGVCKSEDLDLFSC